MIISPGISFFSKFWLFGLLGELKGKKQSRMTKNTVCRTPYLTNRTSHDWHLWCKCVKWWHLQVFFSISKFWFSSLSGGWKGKKWHKMTKIFVCCTLYFRNHIWSSFMVHMYAYKDKMSSHFFHFFYTSDYLVITCGYFVVTSGYLNAVSTAVLLVGFLSPKESICETRENVFYFTSKALFVLKKIKFYNFRYSRFMMSSNA